MNDFDDMERLKTVRFWTGMTVWLDDKDNGNDDHDLYTTVTLYLLVNMRE